MVGTFRVDATQAECQEILRGEGTLECPSYQDLGTRGPQTGIGSNIYILNISATCFLQAVGAYFPCIQIQKLTGDLMAQTSKCEYPVQTFCRLLTMKSNSTDLQRIFRVIGQGCVARNGIASIQFVFYYDLSSASADIKARRMGEYFIFLCK
jgi:hypothetical protein